MSHRPLLFTCASALLALSACKKDDDGTGTTAPPAPTAQDYAQLTIGNYWVYERYSLDEQGNEADLGLTDSVAVVGDTIVSGRTYAVLAGTRSVVSNGPYRSFETDSAGYLIGLGGIRFFSISNNEEVLSTSELLNPPGTITRRMLAGSTSCTVPAGNFTCKAVRTEIETTAFPSRATHTYYALGVGRSWSESRYLSSGNGFRHKLVRYHVQ